MKKRIAVMILALVVCLCLPAVAFAAELITVGDFTIAPTDGSTVLTEGTDYTYSNGKLTVTTTIPVTIGMKDGVTKTAETIVVDSAKGETTVTFASIGIDTTEDAAIAVKGKNAVTFAFTGESTLSAVGNDGINVASNTPIVLTSIASGKLSISGVKFGIFLDGYSAGGSVSISGDLNLDISGCTSHAIYCRNTGSATISGTPVINIDTVEYAIYAHGIDISGGTITIKSDDGYPITSAEGTYITLRNTADLHIIDGRGGLRVSKGKITITDFAKYKVYSMESGSKTAVADGWPLISSGELEISKNAVLELYSANDALSGGKTSILNSANVDIVIDTNSTYSEYALSFSDTLTISGNASVDIKVTKGTKVRGLHGSSGTVNISGNAALSIDGTTYYGTCVSALNLSGNASVNIKVAAEYGIYGDITVKDAAVLTATSVDSRVLYDPCTITPAEGKAYMVKYGKSEAEATTAYYTATEKINDKSTWRYFHVETTDVIPITISGVKMAEESYVYDGTAVSYDNSGLSISQSDAKAEDLVYTYTGTANDGTPWNSTDAPTKAGSYTLTVTHSDTAHYIGKQVIEFTIEQKKIDIPAQPDAVTYNGASQTYGVTATAAYTVTGGVRTDANEAGYDVTISLTDKANTCWANGTTADLTHKFIIIKAEVVEPTQAEAVTYNGSEQTYAVASTDDYTVTGGAQTAANEEGYIVTISLKDQDNYKWKDSGNSDNLTHKFIINKKSVTITAEDKSAYVGNKQPELTYTVSGLIGVDELTTEPTLTTNADMKLVGEYTITASGADAGSNYTITHMPGKLTVEQIPVTLYSITKAPCENGKVTVQAVMAAKGSTIKVSAVPAEGYKVVSLTVTDAAGNEIEVVDGRVTMPASDITVSAVFVYDLPYIDVADDNEHYTAIAYMYVNGLMVGTSTEEYIFDGDVTMTRAQIAQILYCLAGKPAAGYAGTFTDVAEGAWYASAVEWAAAEGIVYGVGNDKFAPDRTITTAEMAALIYRYTQCEQNGECTTSDWLTESAEALSWCVDNGILTDTSAVANRYLAAEMFYNMHNLLNK